MSRLPILLYGVIGYAVFFATFLYLIGFVVGEAVSDYLPFTVDSGGAIQAPLVAVLINISMIALFGIQHTIMARGRFKERVASVLPQSIERTTFMLVTCAILALIFTQWRPLPTVIWSVDGTAAIVIYALAATGWAMVLLSTFLIDHFDLFGLRQTWLAFRGVPYSQEPFQERSLYRMVRHPLMLSFILAFWATPHMSLGHLVFSSAFTFYIALGIRVEERELITIHGAAYREYQRRVPQILPLRRPERAPLVET